MNKLPFDSFKDELIFVKNRESDITPWDKTKITAILIDETGLPFNVAERISDEVQKVIFSSGLKTVSSVLIREIVNSKLIEHGYSKLLTKTQRLGLSNRDVANILLRSVPYRDYFVNTPRLSSNYISSTVKEQYAQSNIFTQNAVELHFEGKFHINGIDSPDSLSAVSIDCLKLSQFSFFSDNFFLNKPKSAENLLNNLVKTTTLLNHFVSDTVLLFNLEKAFLSYGVDKDALSDYLKRYVTILENGAVNEKPVKIYVENKETVKRLADFYSSGLFLKSEIFTPFQSYYPSNNIAVLSKDYVSEMFVAENITLNIPRLALEFKVNMKAFSKQLFEIMDVAYQSFVKKAVFLEKMVFVKDGGVYGFLKSLGFNPLKSVFALSLCGLREAVTLLQGKERIDSSSLKLAENILEEIKQNISVLNNKYKIKVLLTDSEQSDVAYKFARLDLKFEPYNASKIVCGDLSKGAIYYSHNASFPPQYQGEIIESVSIEERLKSFYDFPFKTVVKVITFENVKNVLINSAPNHLILTQDFSVCYHCGVMISGLYNSCPECLNGGIDRYFYVYSRFVPYSKLNRALKTKNNNSVYYEDFVP